MSRTLNDLLAADEFARQFGGSLNPRLRQAVEAEFSFPAKSSGPIGSLDDASSIENVVVLNLSTERGQGAA